MSGLPTVLWVALAVFPVASSALGNDRPVPQSEIVADLDGDGRPETVRAFLDSRSAWGFVTVTTGADVWTSPLFRLWQAATGDVDGDGRAEVLFGIWTDHGRHGEPPPSRTVWVMRWTASELVAAWRGSALARPFADFAVGDIDRDGHADLLVLETSDSACRLTAYRWNDFGFVGLAHGPIDCTSSRLCEPVDGLCVWQGAARKTVRLRNRSLVLE